MATRGNIFKLNHVVFKYDLRKYFFTNRIVILWNDLPVYVVTADTIITIDHSTACTIATSLIHSKIDYCNSLLLNLPATQTNRLQLVLNSAARAVN